MNFPKEIKAEVAIDMIEANKPGLSYTVQFSGKFTRNFDKDILNYDEADKHIQNPELDEIGLSFKLNRDGFYKTLPEALFHDCNRFAKNRHLDPTDFKREYQKQKDEIIFANKFFSPFENVLFKLRTKTERTVNETLSKNAEFIIRSCQSDGFDATSLRDELKGYYRRFTELIPYASDIKGDISKIIFALNFILDVKAELKTETTHKMFSCSQHDNYFRIGVVRLGENMVCGKEFYDENYKWTFKIVMDNKMISDYLSNNTVSLLLNKYFTEYFIPTEIDVYYDIKSEEMYDFQIGKSSDENNRHLGYNVKL